VDSTRAVASLTAGLANGGFKTARAAVGDQQALVARRSEFRWEWVGSRMHTFVVALSAAELEANRAQALSTEAQDYAIKHKGGLPRGLQTGTATIAVIISDEADEESVAWFKQEPTHRYAALLFPVLARPGSEELAYFSGRWSRGYLYRDYLLGIVRGHHRSGARWPRTDEVIKALAQDRRRPVSLGLCDAGAARSVRGSTPSETGCRSELP
jgi:hypothetical protein